MLSSSVRALVCSALATHHVRRLQTAAGQTLLRRPGSAVCRSLADYC
jgi:hypothetical protein